MTTAPSTDTAAASTTTETAASTTTQNETPNPTSPNPAGDTATATTGEAADKGATTDDPAKAGAPDTFAVPEAYKDKPWAAKVKSVDDLWKLTENSQQLIGRKHAVPDFANATPTEIEQFRAAQRPQDEKAYDMSAGAKDYEPSPMDGEFAKAFHKAGVHPAIANDLIKDLKGVIVAQTEKAFDADSFLSDMEKSFGNGYEVKTNQTRQLIESNLSKDDNAAIEGIPNKYLGVMYRLAANLQKAYGAKENGLAGEHNAGPIHQDVNQTRTELRKQIQELDRKPHTAEQKSELIEKLNATYRTK